VAGQDGWLKRLCCAGLVATAIAACAGVTSSPSQSPDLAEQHASALVSLGAAGAEKVAAERLSALHAMREAKLLPLAQLAARSVVAGADLAARSIDGVDCLQWLAAQDVSFEVVSDYVAERPPRARDSCTVEQPIRLDGQIGGVRFGRDNMLMSCELARSMVRFAAVLEAHDITEVEIATPFNCRSMLRGRRVSQHAHGSALDVRLLRTGSGREFPLRDWERRDPTPESEGGRLWYEIVHQLHEQRIFNIILTPDFDRAHRHWLHLDLTPGQHMLR
jgi:hypothetical protein